MGLIWALEKILSMYAGEELLLAYLFLVVCNYCFSSSKCCIFKTQKIFDVMVVIFFELFICIKEIYIATKILSFAYLPIKFGK